MKDMYLPDKIRDLGVAFLAGAGACVIWSLVSSYYVLVLAVTCLGFGIAAFLCWKNQWAEMVSDEEFVYSTMFGRKTKYRFSDIVGLVEHKDSMTLYLKNGKVHMESCAVISERFANAINEVLQQL